MKDKIIQLETIKERVKWIYDTYKEAIELDKMLIIIYENYFGSTKYNEDSIKRAGRYWRSKLPDIYQRSDVGKAESNEWQETFKGVFRK